MTRNTHDRTRDHRGTESTDVVTLAYALAGLPVGEPLSSLIRMIAERVILSTHREVAMADYGSGLEPVTDALGDWLYATYPEVPLPEHHLEVAMADFGSGLEPVTNAAGDWLYSNYPGA